MEVTLYETQSCPFCAKVRRFLEENDIAVPAKDISENSENRRELVEIGGKSQVPCLVVDGRAIYESDDIIAWFQENKVSS